MTLHKFPTKLAAQAAGYVGASSKIGDYGHCAIISSDTSGPNEIGYRYSIHVRVPAWIDDALIPTYSPYFGDSVQVWTDDLNLVRQPGSFAVMYAPDTLAKAREEASKWVDAYLAADPARQERIRVRLAEAAAATLRRNAKQAARMARRHPTQGA